MASPTQWTWVWVNSGSWWWTGRSGVLQSMGLQRVGDDWGTDWTEHYRKLLYWHLSDVFLRIRYGMSFGEENHRSTVPSHHIISRAHTISMACHCWCQAWIPGWSGVCSTCHCKVTPLPQPAFRAAVLRRKSLRTGHAWVRSWPLSPWGWSSYISYLEFFCMEICLLFHSHLFNNLFTSIWTYMFILHFFRF